ncbi:MAG: mannosyltransferase [Bacteroidetes bacterium]|nr:mannosyltransferase [Bacteroidota bacterium]
MVDEVATRVTRLILLICSLLGYVVITYFTPREYTYQLFTLFAVLFAVYVYLVVNAKDWSSVKFLIVASILIRFALLWLTPNLSDDYFRFIWDGRLISSGLNPYQYLPAELAGSQEGLTTELLNQLNSANYYSVYPPVHQFIFGTAATFFSGYEKGAIMVMRLFIITADVGIVWIGVKLLRMFGLPIKSILWYAINPLVIIELTGNLHFEAIMLFFLLFSIYFLIKEEIYKSAIVFALAVSAKLIPLIFLPILINYLGFKRGVIFSGVAGIVVLITFIPFINSEIITNMASTLDLYFQNFEFNASVYYVAGAVFKMIVGYNLIVVVGPSISLIALILILIISLNTRVREVNKLFIGMLLSLTVYYLFSTTIHPWYISSLILLSVFTRYKFAIAWSILVVLSYFAYKQSPVEENMLLLWNSYGISSC